MTVRNDLELIVDKNGDPLPQRYNPVTGEMELEDNNVQLTGSLIGYSTEMITNTQTLEPGETLEIDVSNKTGDQFRVAFREADFYNRGGVVHYQNSREAGNFGSGTRRVFDISSKYSPMLINGEFNTYVSKWLPRYAEFSRFLIENQGDSTISLFSVHLISAFGKADDSWLYSDNNMTIKSTDTKPIVGQHGQTLMETDTGKVYVYDVKDGWKEW